MIKKRKKVNKSVSLNEDVYERLLIVCERLGVNVNAYLVSAVGQQLQRDEAPIKAQEAVISQLIKSVENEISTIEFQDKILGEAETFVSSLKKK